MLPPQPNNRLRSNPPSSNKLQFDYGAPTDTDDGSAPIVDLDPPRAFSEKDPLAADLENALSSVKSIGTGFSQYFDVMKKAVDEGRSDKGLVREVFGDFFDTVYARLRPILIGVIVLMLGACIIIYVKATSPAQKSSASPSVATTAASETTDEEAQQNSDLKKAYNATSPDNDDDRTAVTSVSPDVDISRESSSIPQTLKYGVSSVLANMQLNNARLPGVQGPDAPDISFLIRPGTSTGDPASAGIWSTGWFSGPTATDLGPTNSKPGPMPTTAAGAGTTQPWSDDLGSVKDFEAPDAFSNGDENGIMHALYIEYKTHPDSVISRQSGEAIAALYWMRADGALRSGNTAVALKDWKIVARYDRLDPIAHVARQRIHFYQEGMFSASFGHRVHVKAKAKHLRRHQS